MSHKWRPDRPAREWPNRHPVWAWVPVFMALASMLAICTYRYIAVWTPLQRFYFITYVRSGLRSATTFARTGQYELLAVATKNRSHWACDGEVTEAKTESGEATVTLTLEARKTGALHLVLLPVLAEDAKMHGFLRHGINGDKRSPILCDPHCRALWRPCFFGLLSRSQRMQPEPANARRADVGSGRSWFHLRFSIAEIVPMLSVLR